MGTRLFIGNLSYNVNEQELREAFTGEGIEVRSVRVALDRDTGRPRGFAFVETMTDDGAKASIEKLSGRILQGRPIIVEEAQAKPAGPRPGGGPAARRARAASAVHRVPAVRARRPGRRPSARPGRRSGRRRLRRPAAPGRLRRSAVGRAVRRGFGPPRGPGRLRPAARPGGFDAGPAAAPARPGDAPPRRERPEKKKSTRPKPEERERGNWRWNGNVDED